MTGIYLLIQKMTRQARTHWFVGSITVLALALAAGASTSSLPFPGWWAFASFVGVAFVLETLNTNLRVEAKGSTAFIMHLSAGLLFGAFWSGLITGLSTLLGEIARGNRPIKLIFNVSQRIIAVVAAALLYSILGGHLPPLYLLPGASLSSEALQSDLGLFLVFAASYFLLNSILVGMVVATSSERSFKEVWNLNTRGVLGYDIGASLIALLVAWWYTSVQRWVGFGPLGLVGVVVPVIAARHVYGLYHQLQESGEELLQLMVKAIEARDPYTSGHSLRVRALSRAIATELGLSMKEIEQVETAALLHDVGKIHEEFAPLLRKDSRLTPEETVLMQTHSTKSAELVGVISKFRGFIEDCVRHHHERWDGQGYPLGISGKHIPLGARIILISDTIDAMTTDRPYRKRLGLDIVIAELQKYRGQQFDPEIVDVAVSSVAVRRIIVGPQATLDMSIAAPNSKKVTWPAGALWKARRA
ncbi:MAG: HD domain-containing phosphohydrolase [Gemmatimonadales bacterium]